MADLYTGKTDAQMANDIVSDSADLYVAEEITPAGSETAVLDKTTPASTTLTPAVSPTWTISELVGNKVILQDDNGDATIFVISANTADSFTVDLTLDFYGGDKSGDYTDAATFEYVLFEADQFAGWTDPGTFTDEDETKEFKVGLPKQTIREDLVDNTVSVEIPLRLSGPGAWQLGYNLVEDSNTTYYVLHKESDPAQRPRLLTTLRNAYKKTSKTQDLILLNSIAKSTGSNPLGGTDDGYQMINLMFTGLQDTLSEKKYSVRIKK